MPRPPRFPSSARSGPDWPGLVILAALLGVCCWPIAGAPATVDEPPQIYRYLIAVDLSSDMKARQEYVRKTVADLLLGGVGGLARTGDVVGVWTLKGSQISKSFPAQVWIPARSQDLAFSVDAHLQKQRTGRKTQLADLLAQLQRTAGQAGVLTAIILTDGAKPVKGTPFDSRINGIFAQHTADMKQAKRPFVLSMLSRDGEWIAYAVSPGGGKIDIPFLPEEITPPALARQKDALFNRPAPALAPTNRADASSPTPPQSALESPTSVRPTLPAKPAPAETALAAAPIQPPPQAALAESGSPAVVPASKTTPLPPPTPDPALPPTASSDGAPSTVEQTATSRPASTPLPPPPPAEAHRSIQPTAATPTLPSAEPSAPVNPLEPPVTKAPSSATSVAGTPVPAGDILVTPIPHRPQAKPAPPSRTSEDSMPPAPPAELAAARDPAAQAVVAPIRPRNLLMVALVLLAAAAGIAVLMVRSHRSPAEPTFISQSFDRERR